MDSDALKSPLRPSVLVTPCFRGHGVQGGNAGHAGSPRWERTGQDWTRGLCESRVGEREGGEQGAGGGREG